MFRDVGNLGDRGLVGNTVPDFGRFIHITIRGGGKVIEPKYSKH